MALNSGQAQLAIEYSTRDAPPVAERQGYLAKQTFELAVLREKPSIGDGTPPVAALFIPMTTDNGDTRFWFAK